MNTKREQRKESEVEGEVSSGVDGNALTPLHGDALKTDGFVMNWLFSRIIAMT